VAGVPRNQLMVERIEAAPLDGVVRFALAGDSGAWWDPTADAIYTALVEQVAALDPAPAFFVNLGDFAGPGTPDRHDHYVRQMETLPIPNVCVVGNHDLDDVTGPAVFERIHGPMNFDFACGHTRFVAIHAEGGEPGRADFPGYGTPAGTRGPRDDDLAFLDERLSVTDEPNRVVLMHQPPYLDGHYAPHPDWGFKRGEAEFLEIVRRHGVKLVCCAHGLAFDHTVRGGIHFVMSGGGGTGLCSHMRGVCTEGEGHPEDRGALFHAVVMEVAEDGSVAGRVLQAFDRDGATTRPF
jgi:hypothetical protein